ncbi:MAG: NrdH-redoxin [Candidatus Blackburnbacteria bacterium RIFCSPHIGHO2_01_FULL_44_64]|nr:MAG: NrdH-redoxin [Candidatus Blackburnbacteria bacterium RIFCSPHIGHO2_01_FULL_44_64]OGY14191.1 MAG: NrdH-redoxin [Candidatus Blackburnbacteria bacterium RIFCSPLOWO2_01_FULL_44_43]HXK35545.1 glutaredoxin domain-containing protein [Candidatus Paceibacterota bacterium]
MPNPKIEIFTTPTCHFCQLAKQYFNSKNLEYIEYNVAFDHIKAQEMINATGQMGVPVIRIDGRVIVGFDRPLIEKMLKIGLKPAA